MPGWVVVAGLMVAVVGIVFYVQAPPGSVMAPLVMTVAISVFMGSLVAWGFALQTSDQQVARATLAQKYPSIDTFGLLEDVDDLWQIDGEWYRCQLRRSDRNLDALSLLCTTSNMDPALAPLGSLFEPETADSP